MLEAETLVKTIGYGSRFGRPHHVVDNPATIDEWISHWQHYKKLVVPGKRGVVEVNAQYVIGGGEDIAGRWFHAFVRWHGGTNRDFHVLFVGEGVEVQPGALPILCVPGLDPALAWWVLPSGVQGE